MEIGRQGEIRPFEPERKPKLEVLDALRGFCALIVFALHFSENYIPHFGIRLIPHGCLPVEYFFMLTGFTLIYAYDDKWNHGMSVGGFLRRRFVRLHPLVVVGSIIGAACYLLCAEQYAGRFPSCNLWQLGLLTLWCCMLLPAPSLFGWKLLHPLQGPLWTLLYIYFANILYVLVLRRLKTWMLALLGVAAIFMTWHFGVRSGGFHCGAEWSWWYGSGWPTCERIWHSSNMGAIARMAFPLLAGMVIARKGWRIRTGNWSLWICIAILSAIFFAPELRPVTSASWPLDATPLLSSLGLAANHALNGGFEAAAVVVGMPLVLLIGIGGEIRNRKLANVCRFLGKYSFPLYCTHYSMTILQRVWRDAHMDAPWQMHLASVCACAFFAFVNAYVAMKIAEWASARFGRKESGR